MQSQTMRLPDANVALAEPAAREPRELRLLRQTKALGLFDAETYLAQNNDVRLSGLDPWEHFLRHGLPEGRYFTSAEIVARILFRMHNDLTAARNRYIEAAAAMFDDQGFAPAARFAKKGMKVGVYLNDNGNFFMKSLADLLAIGLTSAGIDAVQRNEKSAKNERFDLRIFVAPHEFFILGEGKSWAAVASAPNTVFYNVEQLQTSWFCQVFPLLLKVPLVLDLNFQSAEVLRKLGLNVVHFAPGYLPATAYSAPVVDVSSIELLRGYAFASQPYDWTESRRADSRPIDLLYIGTRAARRDVALERLRELSDRFRFLCMYTGNEVPLTSRNYAHASTQLGCALGQRTKIVLNIHRDWLGYFEWARIVLQGIWQGACVVSEPGLPDPIFHAGVHYLEEDGRHLRELVEWLLSSADGRARLEGTAAAGYQRARDLGCMRVAITPVLAEFEKIFETPVREAPARTKRR